MPREMIRKICVCMYGCKSMCVCVCVDSNGMWKKQSEKWHGVTLKNGSALVQLRGYVGSTFLGKDISTYISINSQV